MNKLNTCTICNTEVTQNYCPNCGQQISQSDTTLKSLISDFFSNLLSLDKSVFAGIIKIITNPKELVTNYWRGHRKYYPSPSKLFFYAIAIAALHLTYVNKELLGLSFGDEQGQILFWVIFFPILTLTSYLSFFRKKHSLTKHIISIGYIASCFFIIGILLVALLIPFSIDIGPTTFLIFIAIVFIWNAIVYIPKPVASQIFIYTFLQLIVFAVVVGLVVGLIFLVASDKVNFQLD